MATPHLKPHYNLSQLDTISDEINIKGRDNLLGGVVDAQGCCNNKLMEEDPIIQNEVTFNDPNMLTRSLPLSEAHRYSNSRENHVRLHEHFG